MSESATVGILNVQLRADVAAFTAAMNAAMADIKKIGDALQRDLEPRQRAVNAAVSDSLDTYKRLGESAPAALTNLRKATADAVQPAEALHTSFLNMTASFISAQAVIGIVKTTFGVLTDAVKDSITAANEAEHAHAQVTAALRAQGQATPSVIDAYGQYATALQKTTTYQDDALEGAEALLVTVGNVMPKDMNRALEAVTNLAAGMNIDLTSAAENVAKAAEGNVGSLRKMGVEVDASKVKAQGFGVVLDAINDKFAGQAAAIAGTYEGRLTQLANTWNNVQESVGRAITTNQTVLDLLDAINGTIDTNTKELNQNATVNNLVSDAVVLSVRAYSELIGAIDLAQRAGLEFRTVIESTTSELANYGIVALQAGKALLFLSGNAGATQPYDEMIGNLRLSIVLLNADSQLAAQHSREVSGELDKMRTRADALATQLESTRGQTRQLADALGGSGVGGGGGAAGGLAGSLDKLAENWATASYSIAQSIRFQKEQYAAATDDALAAVNAYLQMQSLVRHGLGGVPLPQAVSLTAPRFLSLGDIASPGGPDDPFRGMPKATPSGEFINQDFKTALSATFTGKGFGDDLAKAIMGAIQGGGNVGDAAGSLIGNELGSSASKAFGSGLQGALGKTVGGAVAASLPAIGALLGPLAGKLVDKIVNIFTGGEGAKANDLRDQLKAKFGDAAGAGLQAAVESLGNVPGLQAAYDRFMHAGTQKDVQGSFDALNKVIGDTNDTLTKYGLSLDDLKTPQQQFGDALKDVFTLQGVGFSNDQIARGMADSLNGLLSVAVDTGQKLPSALEPYLDSLAQAGLLNDDLKKKILGLPDPVPWEKMQSDAESLGIDISQLGDKFNNARWSSIVADAGDKFTFLTQNATDAAVVIAGIDTNTGGVKDAIEGLVRSSEKFGTEIPANARPMIEALERAGELTDDNGEKLTDLTKLTFGKDLSEDFQTLIDKLDEFIDHINGPGGLAASLVNLPQPKINWPSPPGSTVSPEQQAAYDASKASGTGGYQLGGQWVFGSPGDPSLNEPAPQMAGGGVVFPRPGGTLVNVAEKGYPETILPGNWSALVAEADRMPNFASAMAGVGISSIDTGRPVNLGQAIDGNGGGTIEFYLDTDRMAYALVPKWPRARQRYGLKAN
jgi:hypothetical protein